MMEYRVRSKRSDAWALERRGAMVTPDMVNLVLTGPARVLKPDGKPLAVFLPGAVADLSESMFADFSSIRISTDTRGYASGKSKSGKKRHTGHRVNSGVLGSFEYGRSNHPGWRTTEDGKRARLCRLTAFTAQQVDHWDRLTPMFRRIATLLEENVPERYANQAAEAARTHDDWVIKGTPFTTITVNNTYPTGVHTDKGDLDAGFSTLACMRRGYYTGGWLTFPQYGVAADMQDGDVLLMDAHEWHGNTPLICQCGEQLRAPDHYCSPGLKEEPGAYVSPERVSIVSYFRTDMVNCRSQEVEDADWVRVTEETAARGLGIEEVV